MNNVEKSNHPSAVRSRKMIAEALISLMMQKEYSKITITDIANEAQIARKTFYQHFYSLEDILDEYIQMLYIDYIDTISKVQITSIIEHVELYFQFWQQHMHFLSLLSKHKLLVFILRKYEELVPYLHTYLPCQLQHDTTEFEYYTAFTSGAFWMLLCKWVERGGKEQPEVMANAFQTFFLEMAKTR